MECCYYCGSTARPLWQCDYTDNGTCPRIVCTAHSVPEFEDGARYSFALCKGHAIEKGRWPEDGRTVEEMPRKRPAQVTACLLDSLDSAQL